MKNLSVNRNVVPATINGFFNDLLNNDFSKYFMNTSDSEWLNQASVPVNVKETGEGYEMDIVIPGVKKEDVKLSNNDNILNISYEHQEEQKSENEENGQKVIRKEYQLRSFKRSFTLGDQIDAAKINARYEAGILKVTLPKKVVNKEANKVIEIA